MTKESEDNTQKELHALYQHIEQERPSKALDNAILELAASNAKPRVKSQSFLAQAPLAIIFCSFCIIGGHFVCD